MKKIFLIFAIAFLVNSSFGQSIYKITITGNGNLETIAFGLDGYVVMNISKDGYVGKWGYDRFTARGQENYPGILDAYIGRVEYYSQDVDEAFRGKVQYIGSILLTYYASYENDALKGKLKSIGSFNIEYYQSYENESYRGYIQSIGPNQVSWYSSFDNEALRGKLKSFGNTEISYYSSFEDKAYRGKVKSLNGFMYTYYSSFERYSGSMKTGSTVQFVNAVKFYIRN